MSEVVAAAEYEITADDCQRWIKKLQRMSVSCQKKGDGEGCKMFAAMAALVERMGEGIYQEEMRELFPNPLSHLIGEA